MRIGLYGGSFNPVHLGHLLVAQAAQEELQLDRIVFVPAAESPFKPGHPLLPGKDRLRLLNLALCGRSRWQVDACEIERGGVSYSVETVREYHARYPGSELHLLIGADHVPKLHQWRDSELLAQLAWILVVPRPGLPTADLPPPFRGTWLRGFPLDVSSSQIRERVRARLPIELLTGPLVAEDIVKNGLYL